ncbi:MAG: 50S ribosomal protein L9 [Tepidiformaceae bacterium]
MKVVFFEDVEGTAQVGDLKEVKNGFARNYLLPRQLAGAPTRDNMQHAQALAQKEARRQEKLDVEARKSTERLDSYTVTLEARVGESGRLFGSITNRDIAEKLNAATGLAIDAHTVLLAEPIRELGARPVTVKFTRNVSIEVTVDVVPDEESKPVVAKLMAEREAEAAALQKATEAAAYAAAQAREAGPLTAEGALESDDESEADDGEE